MPTYRLPWPDTAVPAGCPTEMLYEIEGDDVRRSVELFADGRLERLSVENENARWGDAASVIGAPWSDVESEIPDLAQHAIDAAAFEALWRRATDRT